MKKVFISIVVGATILIISLFSEEKVKIIKNEKPKYEGTNFISLNLSFTIKIGRTNDDIYLTDVSWMDVDDFGDLYILDAYESRFLVFNENGDYLRSIGREGEGPSEMFKPMSFSIVGNKIFVVEKQRGIKIFYTNGDYFDFVLPPQKYRTVTALKAFKDYVYGLTLTIERGKTVYRDWHFVKFSMDFKKGKRLVKYKKKFNNFNMTPRMLINQVDSEHNIYLPDSDDEYLINKYDNKGKLVLSFSRDFRRLPYSNEFKQWAKRTYKEKISPPTYPQIVRCIYIDDRDLLWVLVGECYLDSMGALQVDSIIDIFNNDGEYLYSFTINSIGSAVMIKKRRLYIGPNVSIEDKLKVYDITYSIDQK